eukprot:m51a1_g3097 hypothetical protein (705) ;mRNA; f:111279-114805
MLEITPILRQYSALDLMPLLVHSGLVSVRSLVLATPQALSEVHARLSPEDSARLSIIIAQVQREHAAPAAQGAHSAAPQPAAPALSIPAEIVIGGAPSPPPVAACGSLAVSRAAEVRAAIAAALATPVGSRQALDVGCAFEAAERCVLWVDDAIRGKHDLTRRGASGRGTAVFSSAFALHSWLFGNAAYVASPKLCVVASGCAESDDGARRVVNAVRSINADIPVAVLCAGSSSESLWRLASTGVVATRDSRGLADFIASPRRAAASSPRAPSSLASPLSPVLSPSSSLQRQTSSSSSTAARRSSASEASAAGAASASLSAHSSPSPSQCHAAPRPAHSAMDRSLVATEVDPMAEFSAGFSVDEADKFVIWVDDKILSKQDEIADVLVCSKKSKIGVQAFPSAAAMQAWLGKNVRDRKTTEKLRVITNRFRMNDGGDGGAQRTVTVAKNFAPELPVLIYCGNTKAPGLVELRDKKKRVYVVTRKDSLLEFVHKGKLLSRIMRSRSVQWLAAHERHKQYYLREAVHSEPPRLTQGIPAASCWACASRNSRVCTGAEFSSPVSALVAAYHPAEYNLWHKAMLEATELVELLARPPFSLGHAAVHVQKNWEALGAAIRSGNPEMLRLLARPPYSICACAHVGTMLHHVAMDLVMCCNPEIVSALAEPPYELFKQNNDKAQVLKSAMESRRPKEMLRALAELPFAISS